VHAEFVGRLTLIALVLRQDLEDVAAFELPDSLGVGDSGAMHLRDQAIQFALQSDPHPCNPFGAAPEIDLHVLL
jgi:hypothetical protein